MVNKKGGRKMKQFILKLILIVFILTQFISTLTRFIEAICEIFYLYFWGCIE
jgi:hypothetical protein